MKNFVICTVLIACFSASNAHAYMDPGTGSMVLQVLLAVVGAVVLSVRTYWHKIKSLFKRDE